MNIEEKAKSLLKIRPHHSKELEKKLQMRGFDREQVNATIQKLTGEKLIDNQQFAQNYLESLIRYKTFGFYGLKAKLMQRGIGSGEAEFLLKANLAIETEKEIALKLLEKLQEKDKVKLAQKLSRKGFRSEVIGEVISVNIPPLE